MAIDRNLMEIGHEGEGTPPNFTNQYDDSTAAAEALKSLQNEAQLIPTLMGKNSISVENFSTNGAWKTRYPYRFLIYKVSGNSTSLVAGFRLPINPQDISINIPFAIKTTVTSGGILEEHNGMPLKQITINGTTGISIERERNSFSNANTSIIGTIFGGTINASRDFLESVSRSSKEFASSNTPSKLSKTKDVAPSSNFALSKTGYYQYHMLRIFLETYAILKKSKDGKSYRLAFEMGRDKQAYYVTPNNFTTRKSVSSPMEYNYSIAMTAWAEVSVNNIDQATNGELARATRIGRMRKFLNALKNCRKVLTSAKNVISSVRADVESNIFGPINDSILLAKDILSIPIAIADLPKNIRDSFQTSVIANFDTLLRGTEQFNDRFFAKMNNVNLDTSGNQSAQPFLKSTTPGAQDYYVSSIFDDLAVTDSINITQLPVSQEQQAAIDASLDKARQITDNEIKSLISELESLSDALVPSISNRPATDDEWDILYTLYETISESYASIFDGAFRVSTKNQDESKFNNSRAVSALDYWEKNTASFEIPFNRYSSKFSVPFPFKSSLEELARIYLGDATLWPDIAAINGLQAPYVDEEGFSYSFLSNGVGNVFNVSDNKNLYVGQSIYLSSDTEVVTKRKIVAINKISDSNFQITVDGPSNLNLYKTTDGASMKAYLPYTVNSMKRIYIPTNAQSSTDDLETTPISFIDEDIEFVKFSKIDLLLDSKFDLAITQDGFANLAYGSTNLLQAAKLKVATVSGSKLLDPSFGAGIEPGESVADLDVDKIISNINSSFSSDPRYNQPESVNIDINGNTAIMTIFASVKRGNGIMPITIPLTE